MLSPREAFIIGFSLRCADEGLSPAQVQQRLVKTASLLGKTARDDDGDLGAVLPTGAMGRVISDVYGGTAKTFLPKALQGLGEAAVTIPSALGATGGYVAHKATEPLREEEDIKKEELIAELQNWTQRVMEKQKQRSLRPIY